MQHCDDTVTQKYPGMIRKSQVLAKIVGDRVTLKSTGNITFDRNPAVVSYIANC
jgi:hypothetical protein